MEPLVEADPRQLGPYKIIARLGAGGMGVVFLGSKGSQRVALKVMRSSFLDSPTLKTRFEREIATLKKIKSPYVAKYLDSDIEGDLVWHAVEFVNGPTLKEKIENDGPLDEEDWWALYSQMREALNDVHRVGVVHRDLKPANVILSETGVKLIDFGISQDSEATSLTSTGMVAGSPAWLSPEQLEGTEVGPGSDVFSTGSILVYAALGRSPWGSETTMTVPVAYKKILSFDFDLGGLPVAYKEAVSPLLLEKASERSFLDFSLTGKIHNQDLPDAPEKPLSKEDQRPVKTSEPSTPNESKPNEEMKVRDAAKKKSSVSRNSMLALLTVGVAVLIIASIVLRVPFAGISSQDSTQTSASNDSTQTSPASSCVGLGCYAAVSAVADGTEIMITVIPYPETSGMLESVVASPTNSWGEPFRASGCEDRTNEMKKTSQGWELSCTTITDVTTADKPPIVGFRANLRNGEVVRLTVPIKPISAP